MRRYFKNKLNNYKKKDYIFFLLLIILTFIIYGRAIHYDFFIFDDAFHLLNKLELNPFNFKNLIWFWKHSLIPVTYTVWGGVSLISGINNPQYFHLLNINLYAVNSFFVYLLIKKFSTLYLSTDNIAKIEFFSFFGALFYLLHPTHVESTVWISELKGQLGFLFTSLSILTFLKINKFDSNKQKIKHFALCWFFFILGALSKPNFIITPFLLIFIDLFLSKNSLKKVATWAAPFVVPATVIAVIQTLRYSPLEIFPSIINTFIVSSNMLCFYIFKSIFPFYLSFDYQQTIATGLKSVDYLYAIILVNIIIILSAANSKFFSTKKFRIPFLSLIMFSITLLPHLGIIPYLFQNISTTADRYLLYPTLITSIFFTYSLFKISNIKKKFIRISLFTIMGSFLIIIGTQTWVQVSNWKDSETLIKSSLKNNPNSYPLNISLAGQLWHKGKRRESLIYYYSSFFNYKTKNNLVIAMNKALLVKKEDTLYTFLKIKINENYQHRSLLIYLINSIKTDDLIKDKRSKQFLLFLKNNI